MDANYIRKDGFSNPETERFFAQHWDAERMQGQCEALEHCGICVHSYYLIDSPQDRLWMLCLNERSP